MELFTKRAHANNFDLEWLKGKTCLDAGCGSGRYSVALAVHGAKEITAVDVSATGLETARETGVHLCPEGSACLVAYEKSLRKNLIRKTDQAVLFNCASGLKSPMPVQTLELDVSETIDYSKL